MPKRQGVVMNAIALIVAAMLLVLAPAPARTQTNQVTVLKKNQVRILLVHPSNPEHQSIHALLRERRLLEKLVGLLAFIRFPKLLLLKVDGCQGTANAWYEPSERTVTVCYEYIEDVRRHAPTETTPEGVRPEDAILGPTIEVFLHEVAHAIFDLLNVPVLGREEDAADLVAAYVMLRLRKEDARRAVAGTVHMYSNVARSHTPELQDFADVHGLPAQRLFNLMCVAYGADPKLFGYVVEHGHLPEKRADGCADEFQQLDHAVKKLIVPHVDWARVSRVLTTRWLAKR